MSRKFLSGIGLDAEGHVVGGEFSAVNPDDIPPINNATATDLNGVLVGYNGYVTTASYSAGLTFSGFTLSLAGDVAGVEALTGVGFACRIGTSAWTTRTITGSATIDVQLGSGDAGDPVLSVLDSSITNAKLSQVATQTFKGRTAVGLGAPEDLTIAQAKALLNLTGTNSGDVTLAGQNYLSIAGQVITAAQITLTSHVTGILPSANGGTANGFTKFTGPAAAEKTFTLPNASATILTDNAVVTSQQGGTGINNAGRTLTIAANSGTISFTSSVTLTVAAAASVSGTNTGDEVAASDTAAGKIEIAVQSEQETGTDVVRAVTPGRQQYHPSAAKAWVYFTVSGTTVTVQASYNVSSVVRNSTGNYTVNFTTAFSSANYGVSNCMGVNVANTFSLFLRDNGTRAAGSYQFTTIQIDNTGTVDDPARCSLSFFGDQ